MDPLAASLEAGLARLAAAGRSRRRRVVESRDAAGVNARVAGEELLAFCSNDYLGLAGHPRVTEAFERAAREWGVGSGASHLVSGHCREHHALEEELAAFTGRERALLFSTGYMANLAVVTALLGRGDRVFMDRLNHASLLDAGLASGARFARYPHADADALAARLARDDRGGRTLVATDGVFSMDARPQPGRAARGCSWTTPTASACWARPGAGRSRRPGSTPGTLRS